MAAAGVEEDTAVAVAAEVILVAAAAVAVTLAVALVVAEVDTPVEDLAAGVVLFMALLSAVVELLLECERLQAVCIQLVWHARHRSVSRAVQVPFAHHRVQAMLDHLVMSGPQDNFDRAVLIVPSGHERTRVSATNPET